MRYNPGDNPDRKPQNSKLLIARLGGGPFKDIQYLQVFPHQRLFVVTGILPDGKSKVALWDDVEAWIPDNQGLYGHIVSYNFPEVALGAGREYCDALRNKKLFWVIYGSGHIDGIVTPEKPSHVMRYTVFYQNVFAIRLLYAAGNYAFMATTNAINDSNQHFLPEVFPETPDMDEVIEKVQRYVEKMCGL